MSLKILISGFYCGPSPSAGLGIAKSLRSAWPDAKITGIDYWDGASGLHDDSLTQRLVFPPWDLIDHAAHAQTMKDFSSDHIMYSALDLEVAWLSENLPPNNNLLIPSKSSLQYADKPFNLVSEFLPFKNPKIFVESGDDQALYDFCREHSWRIWVKGPYHGARFVTSWRELDHARLSLAKNGSVSHVSYQSHVRGLEESICFSAYKGKLCGAVHMQKRVTTPEGKTWSGKIRDLSPRQLEVVSHAVSKMNWTGGGELELIRDEADQYWLMEFNPRFPAWIYGATIAGKNLPALLVSEATGLKPTNTPKTFSNEFTRIVTEIPVLEELSLPQVKQPEHGQVDAVGKYGASFQFLEDKLLKKDEDFALQKKTTILENRANDLDFQTEKFKKNFKEPTPKRIFFDETADKNFKFAHSLTKLKFIDCQFNVAYSIKTCPDLTFMNKALNANLQAEAISMAEVEHALNNGWSPNQIILNGPAKWWPRTMNDHQGLKAVFCDSLDELERLLQSGRKDQLWGLRLKIPGFNSRFGVDLDSYEEIVRATGLIKLIPKEIKLGFHVHMASNLIGKGHWQDAVESAIVWAKSLVSQTDRKISLFDMGGGYHPRDFGKISWDEIMKYVKKQIPTLEDLVIEPGRALTQDTMAMVTSIQDIRRKQGKITEIVVDTCISELPLARVYPHRFYLDQNDGLEVLGHGNTRILGRVCMEDDILSNGIQLPASIKIGDRILIADSGAYERSMSYEFGYGKSGNAF